MPKWLVPWVVPMSLVIAVLALAVGTSAGPAAGLIIMVLVFALAVSGFAWARRQYLKEHPLNPELQHKPFWRW